MAKRLSFILACGLFLAATVPAQEAQKEKKALRNADIVLMVQNHFDDGTLVKLIEVADTDFDLSGESLVALKNQGVSSTVLRAMLQATQLKKLAATAPPAKPAPAANSAAAPSADSHNPPPADSHLASNNNPANPPAAAPGANGGNQPANNPAPAAANVLVRSNPAPAASMDPASMLQSMGINPRQLAGMQMAAMGMGGMLGGMFSMSSYSAEQMPHVFLLAETHSRAKQEVSPSTALIAQTKFKTGAPSPGATILRSLATEGLSFAAMAGGPAGMVGMSAFSMASGFMPGMRPGAPSMTYVWGLPGRKSSRELNNTDPRFELTYGDIPGVDPDAFEPAIVKLVQTKDNYRLVGATRSKMKARNMMSGGAPENGKWISEERWPTRVYKEERGFYVLRVDQPLEPGEYAVVLRPVKGYKVKPSGLGGHAQVFYSVWDFSVPGASPVEASSKKKK